MCGRENTHWDNTTWLCFKSTSCQQSLNGISTCTCVPTEPPPNGQTGSQCQTDSDCNAYLTCTDNVCTMCSRAGTRDNTSWPYKGTVCRQQLFSNLPMCTVTCKNDADCPGQERCFKWSLWFM